MEHRLSVIENPKPHGKSYNKWLGGNAKPCQRDLLRAAIDAALAKKPENFEVFLKLVEEAGYTVKRGKHVTFMRDGQPQNIRLRSLGEGYSEEELRAVILGTRVHTPRRKKSFPSKASRPTLISQIEAKIGSGKGTAYDQKLKVVKLKSMAETLLFIQKHDFADFDALADYADAASGRTKELTAKIKAAESRMAEIAVLKTHIINYAKTRDIYTAYRKAGYSKKYYDAHESDIIIHKAAKKVFDDLALKKLPTVKSLQAEYSDLLVQKKLDYAELSKARDEAKRLQIYKANAEMLLRTDADEQRQTREHQHFDEHSLSGEVCFGIGKEYWGKGLMREALDEIFCFGFNILRLKKIIAACDVRNVRAVGVIKKCGMSYKRTVPEDRSDCCYFDIYEKSIN